MKRKNLNKTKIILKPPVLDNHYLLLFLPMPVLHFAVPVYLERSTIMQAQSLHPLLGFLLVQVQGAVSETAAEEWPQ